MVYNLPQAFILALFFVSPTHTHPFKVGEIHSLIPLIIFSHVLFENNNKLGFMGLELMMEKTMGSLDVIWFIFRMKKIHA